MTTETVERTQKRDTSEGKRIAHLVDVRRGTADGEYGLCGKKLLGIPAHHDYEMCVVCSDLRRHDPFYRRID